MENLYSSIKIVHIVAGSFALLCGLFAILFRNRVKLHKPVGSIYFWSMTLIFFSSVTMAIFKGNVFFFCLSFFVYYSCLTAKRALSLKNLHKGQRPKWYDWAIEIVFGSLHLLFLLFSVWLFTKDTSFGIISAVFALIGLWSNRNNIKRLKGNIEFSNHWLLAHLGGMLGSYIGAITAFLVNNNKFLHLPNLIVWLGPTILIVPLIIYEVRKRKHKTAKLSTQL